MSKVDVLVDAKSVAMARAHGMDRKIIICQGIVV